MKTVLAYGDSNTWGAATVARPDDRYAYEERWPGVMAATLGGGWRVIEEGLPGRTTVHDDPVEGAYMNGKTYLMPCLRSHRPLDVVAIMLGSNDLKARFAVPASDIAAGAGELVRVVKQAEAGRDGGVPKILLIAPAPMLNHTGERPDIGRMFVGGYEKSLELAPLYRAVAEAHGVAFLDAQAAVDKRRGIGTQGYCMGGPFTIRTAAAAPGRVRAAASFHGAGLVTAQPDSPHLLLGQTRASYLFAIARNDDATAPADKDTLRRAAAAAGRPAEIAVYAADHGWCVPDAPAYNRAEAERAWSRLLALYARL